MIRDWSVFALTAAVLIHTPSSTSRYYPAVRAPNVQITLALGASWSRIVSASEANGERDGASCQALSSCCSYLLPYLDRAGSGEPQQICCTKLSRDEVLRSTVAVSPVYVSMRI